MDFWDLLIISLAGFCSAVIKTGVGIGSGIFLLPTLALAYPAKIALGLGAPLMLISDIIGLRFYWKQWASKEILKKLLGSAVPGLVIGTILLPIIPNNIFKICVGIFGMFYAISFLFPNFPLTKAIKQGTSKFNERHENKRVYIFGFSGGIASVLAHAGGLVWSLYLHAAVPDKRVFVGTIVFMFFLTNLYKTIAYFSLGILQPESLIQVIFTIPCIFLGSYVGNKLNIHMNVDLFKKVVLVFIFIVSFSLCV